MDWILVFKGCSLLTAAGLAVATTYFDIREPAYQRKRLLTRLGKWVVFGMVIALVASFIAEVLSSRKDRREGFHAAQLATSTNQAAERAARTAATAAVDAKTAADRATEASERTQQSMRVLSNVIGGIRNVREEVERAAEPIRQVELDVVIRLPMDHPYLAAYKARLDEGVHEYALLPTSLMNSQQNIGHGMINTVQARVVSASVWINSNHPLFPSDAEKLAREVIVVHEFEMGLYREPIDTRKFLPSRLSIFYSAGSPKRPEPDLGIAERYSTTWPWVLRAAVTPIGDWYEIERQHWAPDPSTWKKSGRVEFVKDLAGSQLIVNIGTHMSETLRQILPSFELTHVVLQINNKTVKMVQESWTKHVTKSGEPFWVYAFPHDPKQMFLQ
jgi:hypothetical protein